MKTMVGEDVFVNRSQLVVSVLVMLLPKLHALHVAWVRLFCQFSLLMLFTIHMNTCRPFISGRFMFIGWPVCFSKFVF